MSKTSGPRRVPLLWILLPYALGIACARFLSPQPTSLLIPLAAGCILIAFFSYRSHCLIWLGSLGLGLACLGAIRFQSVQIPTDGDRSYPPREATIEIEIDTLFNATDPDTALGICWIKQTPAEQTHLSGQRIFFFLDTDTLSAYPKEGETFRVKGVVRMLPSYSEGDRFDAYLRNLGIQNVLKQGDFIAKTQAAAGATAFFNSIREYFSSALSRNAAPKSEYTNALKGLMLGEKSELSSEQKQLFLANGTMHLFAISGLHIGVISICFHTLLTVLRVGNASRAVATLLAVCFFVLVTGGSASSWRALLMVACFYLASFSKRQNAPTNALALSALIYLLILPGQLFQAGFQMSYLTVSSILLLGLPLARTLNKYTPIHSSIPSALLSKPQRWSIVTKNWLLDATGVSVAAFLVSALLGIYYFQILPTYGVLINLIALPLASLAIIAGFLSLLFSSLLSILPASILFNNAAVVLIGLIHLFLEATSSLPAASIQTPSVSAPICSVAILSTLALIAFTYSKAGRKSEPAWQVLTVLFSIGWIAFLAS